MLGQTGISKQCRPRSDAAYDQGLHCLPFIRIIQNVFRARVNKGSPDQLVQCALISYSSQSGYAFCTLNILLEEIYSLVMLYLPKTYGHANYLPF